MFDPTAPVWSDPPDSYVLGEPIELFGESYDTTFVLWAGQEPVDVDWGDAPRPYPTQAGANGANHVIRGPWLGDPNNWPDPEPDGIPDLQALGDDLNNYDDEDGVSMPATLELGASETIQIEVSSLASTGGHVTAWIDWDGSGSWEAAEQIFSGNLPDGVHTLTVLVPTSAVVGQTFARFRISTVGALPPIGPAPDGEVEDHEVILVEPTVALDWGDAPDLSPTAGGYPTRSTNNGANHVIRGPWLGDITDRPDADPDGQQHPSALGDDLDILGPLPGNDDEDGASIPVLVQGVGKSITVEVNSGGLGTGGVVEIWIDFDRNMVWDSLTEQIFGGWLPDGIHAIPVTAPVGSAVGQTFARFRISSQGTGTPEGHAPDGEVEDHEVFIEEPIPDKLDWGDAPRPYPTTSGANGANHLIRGPWLGDASDMPDDEPDGQPEPQAQGDDWDIDPVNPLPNYDDENGVTVPVMTVGQTAYVQVEVNGAAFAPAVLEMWIDWGADGSWNEWGDLVYVGTVGDGMHNIPVNVPPHAVVGQTFLRARISYNGTGSPEGPASDGEVEDHEVFIELAPESLIKWEQLPEPAYPDNVYYGWNELSVYGGTQIAADDWYCDSNLPVTEVIWWGSLLGWTDAHEIPPLPGGFHLAIWSDIPVGPGDPFSHPGDVIWETHVTGVSTTFAGWDYDPITETYEA
ncbi:MAG: GEVED domain-containing protein, partial [Planctomycetota bacterium]